MKKIIVLTLFSSRVFAIEAGLTEAEFMQKILSNDTYFAKDKIYLDIKKLELQASLESYANWQAELTIEFEKSYYDIDKNTTSTYIYEKQRQNTSQRIAISAKKNFLNNPSTLKLSASKDFPHQDITRYKQDNFYNEYEIDTTDNSYALVWTYPFLKHNSNASAFKTYQNNILDLARERLDFIDAKEDMLVDKIADFLSIAALNERRKIHTSYLRELNILSSFNDGDGKILQSAKNLAQNDIDKNNAERKEKIQNLRLSLSDDKLPLENVSLNYAKRARIIPHLRTVIKSNNRDLLRYEIDEQLKQNDIDYYKNQTLPELDFSLSAEKNFNVGNTLTTEYDNKSVEYSSNLTLNIPLGGDVSDEKNLAVALLNLEKIHLDYAAKFNDVLADARALEAGLRIDGRTIDEYPRLLDNLKEGATQEIENYEHQMITLKDLIDTLKQKRDALLDYVELVEEYQLNILEYNDILDNIVR